MKSAWHRVLQNSTENQSLWTGDSAHISCRVSALYFSCGEKTPLQQRLLCCAPARPRRLPDGIEGFGAAPNRTLTEYIVSLRSASCMACVQLASFWFDYFDLLLFSIVKQGTCSTLAMAVLVPAITATAIRHTVWCSTCPSRMKASQPDCFNLAL